MTRIALILALALALPMRASAADARELFQQGSKALEAGNGAEALGAFEEAYKLQPAPSLLYWIGEAFRVAGNNKEAASYFKQYVDKLPNGPKAPEARARLAEFGTEPKKSKKSAKASKKKQQPKLALEEISLDAAPPPKPAPAALALPVAAPAPTPAPAPKVEVAKVDPPPPAPVPAPAAMPPPAPPMVVAMKEAMPAPAPAPAAMPASSVVPQAPAPTKAEPMSVSKPAITANYVGYTARLLTVGSSKTYMKKYATTLSISDSGSLFTNGFHYGYQGELFRNSLYFGYGTQFGGGSETLLRYELSWEALWTPSGTSGIVSPHLGFRLGGILVHSQLLTNGDSKPGIVVAPTAGFDVNLGSNAVLTAGVGYDANLGVTLSQPNASISGWSVDGGVSVRF